MEWCNGSRWARSPIVEFEWMDIVVNLVPPVGEFAMKNLGCVNGILSMDDGFIA